MPSGSCLGYLLKAMGLLKWRFGSQRWRKKRARARYPSNILDLFKKFISCKMEIINKICWTREARNPTSQIWSRAILTGSKLKRHSASAEICREATALSLSGRLPCLNSLRPRHQPPTSTSAESLLNPSHSTSDQVSKVRKSHSATPPSTGVRRGPEHPYLLIKLSIPLIRHLDH